MDTHQYSERIPLLLSLYEMGRIGKDAFSDRIQKIPFQDLLTLCDLLGEDALEKTIHAMGIGFEDEEENDPISSIRIVKNAIRMYRSADHLNELILFAEDSIYPDTKRFLFSLFSLGIKDLSLVEKCVMVDKIHETAGIYQLADSIGVSLKSSSFKECIEALSSMKSIPEQIEERFFSRLLVELRIADIKDLKKIIKKTSGRLCDATLNECIFRRDNLSCDDLIDLLNESLKKGHNSQETMFRDELCIRFQSLSIPVIFEKMKAIRDRELINFIIFNVLDKKKNELLRFLVEEKELKESH